ncbi:transcriptional regulator with XRE-family HTH domain [Streptomyces atratus]
MTGINRRTLPRIESGTSDPGYGDLIRIADAIGVDVADLVRW